MGLLDPLAQFGVPQVSDIHFSIPNAREVLLATFEELFAEKKETFVWTEEYELVAEWLQDNKGKGLFLTGDAGRGKSLLIERIIPYIFNRYHGKIVRVYQAVDLNSKIDEIKQKKLSSIDDLGTEGNYMKYGESREVVYELLDNAERRGKLLIISSNLDSKQFVERYDKRSLERLRGTCRVIKFTGKSMRNG